MSNNTTIEKEFSGQARCIACESDDVSCLGALPVYTEFVQRDANSAGWLFECKNCSLRFRLPQPTPEELLTYYDGQNTAECWQHGPEREVWRYIEDELRDIPTSAILDVGCFRGDLLNYLGNGWDRFGVEPSREAAGEAQRRGIKIIGETIEALREANRQFGAITLIDVIEHVLNPLNSLMILARLLAPGGKLIIFTGSTDALSWRMAGLDYYYSAMPEHLAFMNPAWFKWVAPKLDCKITSIEHLRYEPAPLPQRLDEAFKNLLYIAYHRARRLRFVPRVLFELPLVRRVGKWPGCWWTSAKDHTLVVLTRQVVG